MFTKKNIAIFLVASIVLGSLLVSMSFYQPTLHEQETRPTTPVSSTDNLVGYGLVVATFIAIVVMGIVVTRKDPVEYPSSKVLKTTAGWITAVALLIVICWFGISHLKDYHWGSAVATGTSIATKKDDGRYIGRIWYKTITAPWRSQIAIWVDERDEFHIYPTGLVRIYLPDGRIGTDAPGEYHNWGKDQQGRDTHAPSGYWSFESLVPGQSVAVNLVSEPKFR